MSSPLPERSSITVKTAREILNESRDAAGESSLDNAISLLQTLHFNTASEEETLEANEQAAVDSYVREGFLSVS